LSKSTHSLWELVNVWNLHHHIHCLLFCCCLMICITFLLFVCLCACVFCQTKEKMHYKKVKDDILRQQSSRFRLEAYLRFYILIEKYFKNFSLNKQRGTNHTKLDIVKWPLQVGTTTGLLTDMRSARSHCDNHLYILLSFTKFFIRSSITHIWHIIGCWAASLQYEKMRRRKNQRYVHMALIKSLKERLHLSILSLQGDTPIGHGQYTANVRHHQS
jgi:hypothetical protein